MGRSGPSGFLLDDLGTIVGNLWVIRRTTLLERASKLSPREGEYHQHFNTGPGNARYLAMRLGQLDARSYRGFSPTQIEYEDEDQAIYAEYAAECIENGAEVVLPKPNYTKK